MSATSIYLEETLQKCGGFGRFQRLLLFIYVGSQGSIAFSLLMMSYAAIVPDWKCILNNSSTLIENETHMDGYINFTDTASKTCQPSPSACTKRVFDENMITVVSEWDFVCGKASIPSYVTTIEAAGILVSSLIAGFLGDRFGRKIIWHFSLILMSVFNVICGISINWEMFAVCRFFISFGCGCYIAVTFPFVVEFLPKKYCSLVAGIPAWPLWASLFAFFAMLIHDWRSLHFLAAALTAPWLCSWWFLPESFRWLISYDHLVGAEDVIKKIAKVNGRPDPDMNKLKMALNNDVYVGWKKTCTVRDMFRSFNLSRISVLMILTWFSFGYTCWAASDVQSLSGNIFLNMFLLSIVEIPGQLLTYPLTNCIGRKWSTALFCAISGLAGLIVAGILVTGLENTTYLTVFALISKLGASAGWICCLVLCIESYPTVIRVNSHGLFLASSRAGLLVAIQTTSHDTVPSIPGFVCGGLMLLSVLLLYFIPETKNKAMPDALMNPNLEYENFQNSYMIMPGERDDNVFYVTRL